jgi:hypothetical protein
MPAGPQEVTNSLAQRQRRDGQDSFELSHHFWKLAAVASGGSVARPARSAADLLVQLDELRQNGVLTEAEFQSKKAELLKNM